MRNLIAQLGPRRLMMMGGVALVLLLGLGARRHARPIGPEMGYLYTDLDPAAAQTITEKLNAQNVRFQLSA